MFAMVDMGLRTIMLKEMEWKRIGKKILSGIQIRWNGVELERIWNGKLIREKVNKKWNGDGMEMEWRRNGK